MAGGKTGTDGAPQGGTVDDPPKQDEKRADPPRPPGSPVTIERWGR